MPERRLTPLIMICLATLVLGACAATATGTKRSAMVDAVPYGGLTAEVPPGSALVVIRYPAMVESDAQNAYYNAYFDRPIGGRVGSDVGGSNEARNTADSLIVKSNYFALSLYKELVERLPEHTVLLSPHALTKDADGRLTSEPITSAERIATVLTIDFAAYSFPDPDRMMRSEPLTFGDLITPLVVVRADHRASPATVGLLMSSDVLSGPAAGAAREDAMQSLQGIEMGRFSTTPRELDLISYLTREESLDVADQPLDAYSSINAAQIYPVEKIVLDRRALDQISAPPAPGSNGISLRPDPLERVFSAPLAQRIVAMLNAMDVDKATMLNRAASVATFDPSLAALSLVGLSDQDFLARMRYAERLIDAQRKYLSIQSLRIYDGIHNGEVGAQVREMLAAEWKVIERRRELAEQQNVATALAIASVIATGAVASQADGNFDAADYILVDLLTDAALIATMQAVSINRQSSDVAQNYLTSIVPALSEQTEIQIDLIEANETITAIRFEDLEVKLSALYAENQRAVDAVATNCGYLHDSEVSRGVWQGECAGGLASGVGVGILRSDADTAIEYYGVAREGRPNGAGYMIRHGRDTTIALEGTFVDGRANGAMRVARPGESDAYRMYAAGRDIGPAATEAIVPLAAAGVQRPTRLAHFAAGGAQ